MGKGLLYTLVYSVILVALFVTFLILIKNLIPPQIKDPDPDSTRSISFQDDDYADQDDFPSDIKLEFGLVKVTDKEFRKNYLENYNNELKAKEYGVENSKINVTYVSPPLWPSDTDDEEKNINSKSQRSIKNNRRHNGLHKTDFSNTLFVKLHSEDEPRIEIKIASNSNLPIPFDNKAHVPKKHIDNKTILEGNIKIENGTIIIFNIGNKFIQTLGEIVDFDHIYNITDDNSESITSNAKNEPDTENYIFNLYHKED